MKVLIHDEFVLIVNIDKRCIGIICEGVKHDEYKLGFDVLTKDELVLIAKVLIQVVLVIIVNGFMPAELIFIIVVHYALLARLRMMCL